MLTFTSAVSSLDLSSSALTDITLPTVARLLLPALALSPFFIAATAPAIAIESGSCERTPSRDARFYFSLIALGSDSTNTSKLPLWMMKKYDPVSPCWQIVWPAS